MAAAPSRNESQATTNLVLTDAVVTADVLAAKAKGLRLVEVGAKTIVTPSARDWLRHNKVELQRMALSSKLPAARAIRSAIMAASGIVAERVCVELSKLSSTQWKTETVASVEDAAAKAIEAIGQGLTLSIVFSDEPEKVACLVNRNESARAVAACSIMDVERVRASLQPNVFVIPLGSKSVFELLRMVRIIAG